METKAIVRGEAQINYPPCSGRLSVLQLGAGWFPEFCAGAENVYYHLCKHLPSADVDIRGLVLGSPAVAANSEGRVRAFSPRSGPLRLRLWRARKEIAYEMLAARPDVVASHFALFTLVGLDRLRGAPLVVHFHGPWAEEAAVEGAGRATVMAMGKVEQTVYRRANRLITLSGAFADRLHDRYGIARRLIQVVPGGVDCARFAIPISRAQARQHLSWQEDGPVVLSVRRLAKRMGLPELIRSICKVQRTVPNVRLLIAGKGPEEARLRKLIGEMHLQKAVRLIGFVPEELLPVAYRAADLTIVPSNSLEGFGLSTVESLAAGTPVMVTPVGGMPEIVAPLERRLVLPDCSSDRMADAIVDALLGHIPLPSGDDCQRYARAHFDWDAIASQTKEVYLDATGR